MPVMGKRFSIVAVQPAEIGTDPQPLPPIHVQAYNYIIAQTVAVSRPVIVLGKFAGVPVIVNEATAIAANPDIPFRIFCEIINVIVLQTAGVRRNMPEQGKLDNIRVVKTDTLFIGAYPYNTGIIKEGRCDAVFAEAFVIIDIIKDIADAVGVFIQHINTAMIGAYPDIAIIILQQAYHNIII
jgi:hypothetical protein